MRSPHEVVGMSKGVRSHVDYSELISNKAAYFLFILLVFSSFFSLLFLFAFSLPAQLTSSWVTTNSLAFVDVVIFGSTFTSA